MAQPREYVVVFEGNVKDLSPRIAFRVWAYEAMDAAQQAAVLLTVKYPSHKHTLTEIGPPMDLIQNTFAGVEASKMVDQIMQRVAKNESS